MIGSQGRGTLKSQTLEKETNSHNFPSRKGLFNHLLTMIIYCWIYNPNMHSRMAAADSAVVLFELDVQWD